MYLFVCECLFVHVNVFVCVFVCVDVCVWMCVCDEEQQSMIEML